jgi:hypothetical protein
MHNDMSKESKDRVLGRLRRRYRTAGLEHRSKLLDQAVELLGYHRKAAMRALGAEASAPRTVGVVLGRPKTYHAETLLPILKPIWFAAFQPCGSRLAALLPEWVPAYEADHRRVDADVRQALLAISARTLDRLLAPLRVAGRRRGGTRPGSLLRQSIPIRGDWTEEGPGWLELDTVALCGGRLDDLHLWMLDAVDIRTAWVELRALENRSQHCTLAQIRDLEGSLPFALLGVDSDNGGEFINHHLAAYLGQRPKPVLFTRARPYWKNDNARVESRHVGRRTCGSSLATSGITTRRWRRCSTRCARGRWGSCRTTFCRRINSRRSGARATARCGSMGGRRRLMSGCCWLGR